MEDGPKNSDQAGNPDPNPGDQPGQGQSGSPSEPPPPSDTGTFSQQFQHQPVAARVPERLSRPMMSTGLLVQDYPGEFVLDFLQGLTRPHQIVARVVVSPMVMDQLVNAVRDNLNRYTQAFGSPMELPKPPPRRPSIAEIYENFKLSDELLSGAYANSFMVGHSPAEFFFDFITGFYPTAAVCARVVTAAPYAPRMLEAMSMAAQQYRNRFRPNG